jgi:hypothetical protein
MPNQIIVNKQLSKLTLQPLLNAAGEALVLQPKGDNNDHAEITQAVADDEIIERVRLAGWVHLMPAGTHADETSKPAAIVEPPPETPSTLAVTDKLPIMPPEPETKTEPPAEPPLEPEAKTEASVPPTEPPAPESTVPGSQPVKNKNKNR